MKCGQEETIEYKVFSDLRILLTSFQLVKKLKLTVIQIFNKSFYKTLNSVNLDRNFTGFPWHFNYMTTGQDPHYAIYYFFEICYFFRYSHLWQLAWTF